jgi:sucrose phosphorylase
MTTALQSALTELYGEAIAQSLLTKIDHLVAKYPGKNKISPPPDETTVALICYGDSFQSNGQIPLKVLNNFLITYLGDTISTVHLLPFFPFSSDDGFPLSTIKLSIQN